ncbi:spermatogenesis-associated protein 20 isoform X2 [Pseudomyrmex gracilis]|nr:spermatogenesis-associated protein 20 isoform X2 [Pseudomyrmex gracilis]XP_020279687.1 spermatogenesis-associated protein 20 isoform X2 [Pseudomyrmex gracilis]XP_020279688.1 spermatogenesis-associated protein 20 isoform X2 [Pseudomyrmex gracilis]
MASTSKNNAKNVSCSGVKRLNRLSLEKSPYLLQHATNPVDWYPWCDEALERAKKEDKLILLSVGYSTCHWCHVMEKESFENEEIAQIMNGNFVNIKVDREERPDIDATYMLYVCQTTGGGGWPMTVILTPNLIPVLGGTYFPPESRHGLIGFKTLLLHVAQRWKEQKNEVINSTLKTSKILQHMIDSKQCLKEDDVLPSSEYAILCVYHLSDQYEPDFGGFGEFIDLISNQTKFPTMVKINMLLTMYSLSNTPDLCKLCLEMSIHTLKKIAYGGIHDHVGQGFSRYSVDIKWHVPHFEKMLYDQAQMIQTYADTYVVTKDSFYSDIVDDIATYVERDLRHKEGGFYSAEDADSLPKMEASEKREGAFYVWTYDELKAVLNKKIPGNDNVCFLDLVCHYFNVKKEGNVSRSQDPQGHLTGKNVFIIYDEITNTASKFGISVEDAQKYIKEACQILFVERSKRPRPHLDDKIITAWNGLMISGFARGGAAVRNEKYVELATSAAKFAEQYLFDKNKNVLLRSCYRGENDKIMQTSVPINGFLADYAYLIKGLLDLYEANFDPHWIEVAEKLQNIQDQLFWDSKDAGYFSTVEDPQIILRLKSVYDCMEPSGNAIACSNLLRLAIYLDYDEFKDKAKQILRTFNTKIEKDPSVHIQLILALLEYHNGTQIYIAGKRNAEDTIEMLNVVRERLIPGRVLLLADPDDQDNILLRKNAIVGKMKPQKGRATAFVCRHHTCSLPITDSKELATLLDDKEISGM